MRALTILGLCFCSYLCLCFYMASLSTKPIPKTFVIENGYYYDGKQHKIHGVIRNNTKTALQWVNVQFNFMQDGQWSGSRTLHFEHLKPLERHPFVKDGLDMTNVDKIEVEYLPPTMLPLAQQPHN